MSFGLTVLAAAVGDGDDDHPFLPELIPALAELERIALLGASGEDVAEAGVSAVIVLREILLRRRSDWESTVARSWFDGVLRLVTPQRVRALLSQDCRTRKRAATSMSREIKSMRKERDDRLPRAVRANALPFGCHDHLALMLTFMRVLPALRDGDRDEDAVEELASLCSDLLWRIFEYDVLAKVSVVGGQAGGGERKRTPLLRWIIGVVARDRGVAHSVEEFEDNLFTFSGFSALVDPEWPDVHGLKPEGERIVAYKIVPEDGDRTEPVKDWDRTYLHGIAKEENALVRSPSHEMRRKTSDSKRL